MANQYAIQDPNRFPAGLIHSGTSNSAETIRLTGTTDGAVNVFVVGGTVETTGGGGTSGGTVVQVNNGSIVVTAGTVQATVTGGTLNAGTVSVTGTVPVSGVVSVSSGSISVIAGTTSIVGTVPVSGVVSVSSGSISVIAGTTSIVGTVPISGGVSVSLGTVVGTVSVAVGTVVGTGTNLHTVVDSGTVNVVQTAGTINVGTVTVTSGTVVQATGTNLHAVIDSGTISPVPNTTGGLSPRSLDLDETKGTIKGAAGQLYGYYIFNNSTSIRYVKFYDGTVANVGTTTPVMTFPVPAAASGGIAANLLGGYGVAFGTGIIAAATTGLADNDTGAPSANDVIINAWYK